MVAPPCGHTGRGTPILLEKEVEGTHGGRQYTVHTIIQCKVCGKKYKYDALAKVHEEIE